MYRDDGLVCHVCGRSDSNYIIEGWVTNRYPESVVPTKTRTQICELCHSEGWEPPQETDGSSLIYKNTITGEQKVLKIKIRLSITGVGGED